MIKTKFRVIRVLEYTYDSAERMVEDRQAWFIQGYNGRLGGMTINSTVMIPELVEHEVPDSSKDEL